MSKREGKWVEVYPTPQYQITAFACYCDLYLHQLTQSTLPLDWHATVEKAELLETFADYHPSLLAVLK